MNKRLKILLCVIGIFLVTSILISISYAYYIFNVSQSGSNAITTDCFRVTYTDFNIINLDEQVPLTDEEAQELTPYHFTISNVCNYPVDYSLNIETLEGSTMDSGAIKVKIDSSRPKNLGTIDDNDSSTFINENAINSKTLQTGTIKANDYRYQRMIIYIDENSTVEQSANKSFLSKLVVTTTLNAKYSESIIGYNFNSKIKQLAGNVNASIYTYDTNIKHIVRSTTPPSENDDYIDLSDAGSDKPVYAWFNDSTIYLYSENEKILIKDSSYMFQHLLALEELDLSYFDTSKATSFRGMFEGCEALTSIDVSNFNTSNVTNMSYMFATSGQYHQSRMVLEEIIGLENFDTSNVTDMSNMFSGESEITNLNIENWDVSYVKNMSNMFYLNSSIETLDLSNWNTPRLTNMSNMFGGMDNLSSLDIHSFDTSKVTDMSGLFNSCVKLTNLNISNFDTSKVTSMESMFKNTGVANLDLSSFDTSNVENMKNMLSSSKLRSVNISSFNTSKVTNMAGLLYGDGNLTSIDLSNINTSNVTNMIGMFHGCKALTALDLSHFDTSKVTTMSGMFAETNLTNLDLSSFDTSNVEDMSGMFANCKYLTYVNLSSFNTSKVTNMGIMFAYNTSMVTLDLSSFDTSSLTKMTSNTYRQPEGSIVPTYKGMFEYMTSLTTIFVGENWNVSNVTDSTNAFRYSSNLVGGAGTTYDANHTDKEYAHVDGGTSNPGYFTLKTN